MKIRSAIFHSSAPDLQTCRPSTLPEFAFIGRSNVGKSSLINMLTAVRDLAKVSDTPGKTKLINFFTINHDWSLVDLPGYGYAKVGRQDRAAFSQAVAGYLENRENLRGTFVLIDARLTPQQIDLDFLQWMVERGIAFALIFTKTDKLSSQAAEANMELFKNRLLEISDDLPEILTSSSKAGHGRMEILTFIETALADISASDVEGDDGDEEDES